MCFLSSLSISTAAKISCPSLQLAPTSLLYCQSVKMRALTEEETRAVFSKLATYTGRSLNTLIAPPQSSATDQHTFRLHHSRVYYLPLSLANLATNVARANLVSVGTCLGRFTKAGSFRLHVTALDVVAPHARARVWVKPQGEMPFLYGGHVLRAHVGRATEDTVQHQGVVVCSMNDVPLVSLRAKGAGISRGPVLMWNRVLGSPQGQQRRREGLTRPGSPSSARQT